MNRLPHSFLEIEVHALTISDLNALIDEAVTHNYKRIIANHNLHSLYFYHHNDAVRAFYKKAEYTHIDGMPLVILGQILGLGKSLRREHRVTYADWVWSLISDAVKLKWRIFYLGSKPDVAEQGADILRAKFPGLEIKTGHGYFDTLRDSKENQSVLAAISTYRPDILMVGMGMPRQEKWILNNLAEIQANVILPCGACIDYVAGAIPTPPRWMGRFGLEWSYRLVSEPKRLWKRYLVEPWFILGLLLKEMLISRSSNILK